jgi:hypothetical protein
LRGEENGDFGDHAYYLPSVEMHDTYHIGYGGIHVFPMSALPEERKEAPVDHMVRAIATRKI